jgi:hypothetical protein
MPRERRHRTVALLAQGGSHDADGTVAHPGEQGSLRSQDGPAANLKRRVSREVVNEA